MASCANCTSDAIYTYQITEEFGVHYCQRHLPRFLNGQRLAGKLPLNVPAEPVVEGTSKTSKKKSEPVVDETPAGE